MTPLITPADMRDMERRFFDGTGVQSCDLMETAARALWNVIVTSFGHDKIVGFACGPGGNGGDGYAAARMIQQGGGKAFICSVREPTSPDALRNLHLARMADVEEELDIRPDVWVDALYGTGLSRAPSGPAAALIQRINRDREQGSRVVAVDIPSGLNGLTGEAYSPCVKADITCTFQYAKPGCHMADGLDMSGRVITVDIGIPSEYYPACSPALVGDADLREFLSPRQRNFHKGNAGHLLIVAGSFGMAGAAAMCALSALRSGAGLVTVACPRSIVPIIQTLAPCAMCVPLAESDGAMDDSAAETLRAILPGKTAVVCGCGLSRRASPTVVGIVLESGLPALLDADALNLISENDGLKAALKDHHLITPHPGEAARLLGHRVNNPIEDALELRRLGCQALLKGAATVIPVGDKPLLSTSGTSGMAVGGSGDCLSGVIGALMAQQGRELSGERLAMCAAVGSELHGLAGENAAAVKGIRGMTPLDLIDALPGVLKRYE